MSATAMQLVPTPEERIAVLAHSYWEARGCPIGDSETDWFRAELEILGDSEEPLDTVDEASRESFPASDAPAY